MLLRISTRLFAIPLYETIQNIHFTIFCRNIDKRKEIVDFSVCIYAYTDADIGCANNFGVKQYFSSDL